MNMRSACTTLARPRLVAAIELISPANKDRPEHRSQFTSKCAALLRQGVSLVLVDVVTARNVNLYADLLEADWPAGSVAG